MPPDPTNPPLIQSRPQRGRGAGCTRLLHGRADRGPDPDVPRRAAGPSEAAFSLQAARGACARALRRASPSPPVRPPQLARPAAPVESTPPHPPQPDPVAAEDSPVFLYHKAFLRPGARPPPPEPLPAFAVTGEAPDRAQIAQL